MEAIEKGNWVLVPLTKDDLDNPNIVAKVDSVTDTIVTIELSNDGKVDIPRSWCRVVHIQNFEK